MHYSENLATAASYLKKSIPHMMANEVPANPINYTLWYNYVANHIPELNKALDSLTKTKGNLTPRLSEELYRYYIINEHLEDHQKTLESITQLAAQLVNHLNDSMLGSSNFELEINANIDQLNQAASIGEITAIIDQVINTSESIRTANRHFQDNLQLASEEISNLRQQLKQAEKQAYIDQLTQLYNRHAFDRQLDQLINTEGLAENVCLILADLDHFKSFNDNYGHVIGDRVLHRMGELLQDYCPDNAIAARYGGEEFAIIVNNSTIEDAQAIAEMLRHKTQQLRVKIKNSDKVLDSISASFGVARFQTNETAECFIDRTDQALYRAKHCGRNRVEVYQEGWPPAV
ncbi:GGDEF domain-containing protein [Oceanicoccus sp. KOV_DT_Chl]|uniref:GGDEF domain-containing protein n=1 Tax=Oceanicoccus sp. KOV_DT_Chl TaxID=1904639 RepID=UPI000C7E1FDE|nr:GGDEF domain-containing protein [Oceanicoccus sp. KOV_DT_Chl]